MLSYQMDPYQELVYCVTSATESDFWYILTERYDSIRRLHSRIRKLEDDFELAIQASIRTQVRHVKHVQQLMSDESQFIQFLTEYDLSCKFGKGFYQYINDFLDEVPHRVNPSEVNQDLYIIMEFADDVRKRLVSRECYTKLLDIYFIANQRIDKFDFMR